MVPVNPKEIGGYHGRWCVHGRKFEASHLYVSDPRQRAMWGRRNLVGCQRIAMQFAFSEHPRCAGK